MLSALELEDIGSARKMAMEGSNLKSEVEGRNKDIEFHPVGGREMQVGMAIILFNLVPREELL